MSAGEGLSAVRGSGFEARESEFQARHAGPGHVETGPEAAVGLRAAESFEIVTASDFHLPSFPLTGPAPSQVTQLFRVRKPSRNAGDSGLGGAMLMTSAN